MLVKFLNNNEDTGPECFSEHTGDIFDVVRVHVCFTLLTSSRLLFLQKVTHQVGSRHQDDPLESSALFGS